MSLGLWPEAVPFDPESGTALDDLRKHFDAAVLPGTILLVPGRSLRDSAWAPRAAVGLARALATGRTTVLVDLDFEHPSLHQTVGEPNGEGVADALLFGASLERVTIRPAGEPFEFVPAGAYAPEPEDLMAHAAWARVLAELAARNAILLAWTPLGARGLDALTERISAVIVLAEENEVTPTVALLPEAIRIEGVIRPAAAEPAVASSPPAEVPAASVPEAAPAADTPLPAEPAPGPPRRPKKEEAREALISELRARQQPPPGPEPSAPPPAAAGGTARRFAKLLALVGVLAVAAWLVGRMLARDREPIAGIDTVVPAGSAQPAGEILGYSIAIESYDRLVPALARADSLALAQPGISFYIAPFGLDSATYYRVLAGPIVDSISATATMRGLVDRGLKTAASMDDVRSTPLAFEMGRYDTREEAVRETTTLKARGIPSYVVEVPYTQGPPRFHVYAGAYSGPTEASVMRNVLRNAGIMDTLVLRVGRIPS